MMYVPGQAAVEHTRDSWLSQRHLSPLHVLLLCFGPPSQVTEQPFHALHTPHCEISEGDKNK